MNDTTAATQVTQVTTKAAPRRVYSVRNIKTGEVRLVDATSAAQASRHVAQDSLDVTIPTTVQVFDITKSNPNIEIEVA